MKRELSRARPFHQTSQNRKSCGPITASLARLDIVPPTPITRSLDSIERRLMRRSVQKLAALIAALVWISTSTTHSNAEQSSVATAPVIEGDTTSTCSDSWLSRLEHQSKSVEHTDILTSLQVAAKLCSSSALYHALLSATMEDKGDLANAARELNTAITLDPHQSQFMFRLAQLLYKNGDLGGARICLKRANEQFPDEVWTYLFLATVLRDLGSLSNATQLLEKAAVRWPSDPQVHILLGNILSETDEHTRATTELEKARDLDPKLPQAYLFYGIELDRLNRYDEAEKALTECVNLSPLLPNSHFYLGEVLLKKGRVKEAVQQLNAAIRIDPQYALAYFQLSKAYRQLGDTSRANEYMEQFGSLSAQQQSEDIRRRDHFRDLLKTPE
jgi:tetratricopeptide (TPR) repeat protein